MNSPKIIDHSGSSFDSFLEEEYLLEQSEAVAIKRVIAWQLQRAMKQKRSLQPGRYNAKRIRTVSA
ncbi:MAG: hypothetical protein ABSC64_15000 [Candidatus Korobacteraceae bacterium]|jgi:hypothetical protein